MYYMLLQFQLYNDLLIEEMLDYFLDDTHSGKIPPVQDLYKEAMNTYVSMSDSVSVTYKGQTRCCLCRICIIYERCRNFII